MPMVPRPPTWGEGIIGADCGEDIDMPLWPNEAGDDNAIAIATAASLLINQFARAVVGSRKSTPRLSFCFTVACKSSSASATLCVRPSLRS